MAKYKKIDDIELINLIEQGKTNNEIVEEVANKYDMNTAYLKQKTNRIRREREARKPEVHKEGIPFEVSAMDVLARKADRTRFVVAEVKNGIAKLKKGYKDFPKETQTLYVPIRKLCNEFEKINNPPVTTYNINDKPKKESNVVLSDEKSDKNGEIEPNAEESGEKQGSRRECLQEAMKIVCNDRENTYGSPEDNFSLIAELWTTYTRTDITARDVAIMMAMLKIARIRTGKYKEDNYIDLAGYIACACELGGRE